MRSPLNAILAAADRSAADGVGHSSDIQARQMDPRAQRGVRPHTLADDVVELAHGGKPLVDERPMPFSLSSVLKVVCDCADPATEKRIALINRRTRGRRAVGAPASHVGRVLLNLTTNAECFTSRVRSRSTCEPRTRTKLEFSVPTRDAASLRRAADAVRSLSQRANRSEYAFSSSGLGFRSASSWCRRWRRAEGRDGAGKGTLFLRARPADLAARLGPGKALRSIAVFDWASTAW
jgi:hypothetical protein